VMHYSPRLNLRLRRLESAPPGVIVYAFYHVLTPRHPGGYKLAFHKGSIREKQNMKKMLAVVLTVLGSCFAATAFDTTPLQISVWPPNAQVVPDYIDVAGLKINLPYGGNKNITGLDFGIASASDRTSALQLNLVNVVKEEFTGLQIGLINLDGAASGVKLGLLMNNVDAMSKGIDIGIINTALESHGLQVGLINYCEFMVGVQIGLVNIIRESNVPFFPIINFCF